MSQYSTGNNSMQNCPKGNSKALCQGVSPNQQHNLIMLLKVPPCKVFYISGNETKGCFRSDLNRCSSQLYVTMILKCVYVLFYIKTSTTLYSKYISMDEPMKYADLFSWKLEARYKCTVPRKVHGTVMYRWKWYCIFDSLFLPCIIHKTCSREA